MAEPVENTIVPPSEQFHVFVPFSKVEEQNDGTLMVYGRATEETPDYQGEIMDYESSVPLWKQRTKEFYEISGGNALLPLRAMHQPIAAGKVVGIDYKSEEKAIDIVAHVVDANEVKKVQTHTYNGFSVGGKYSKRQRDLRNPSLVRYTGDPREVSIVDKPAVPTAKFTLFKLEDVEADAPAPSASSGKGELTVAVDVPRPTWLDELKKVTDELTQLQKAQAEAKDAAERKLKAIGSRVGIKRRDGEPLTPPKDYPEDPDEYGDPANFNYPVDEKRHVVAVGRFNGGQGREQYSPRERHILGRRIARLASRFGGKYQYNPDKMQVDRKDAKKMSEPNELSKLDIGGLIAQLKAVRDMAADALKDPSAAKDAMNALMGNLDGIIVDASRPANPSVGEAPVSDPGSTVTVSKVDASTSSSPSSLTPAGTTTTAPAVAKAGATTVGATTTDSSPSSSPTSTPAKKIAATPATTSSSPSDQGKTAATSTSTDDTDAYKALEAKVDKLADGLGKLAEALTKSPAFSKGESPLQALNSVVEKKSEKPAWTEDPIIKALMDGGPYAYVKALKAAGADDAIDGSLAPQRVAEAIRRATYDDLEASGIITKSRYVPKLYSPGESN